MLKIIITTAIVLWPLNIAEIQDINCEYLYFSWQGTEIQNTICASQYKIIEKETIKWKRELLEARGIY